MLFLFLCVAFSFNATFLSANDFYLEPGQTLTLGSQVANVNNNVYVKGGTLKVDGATDITANFIYDDSSKLTIDLNNSSIDRPWITPMTQSLLSSDSRDIDVINSGKTSAYLNLGTNYEYNRVNYSNFSGAYVAKEDAVIEIWANHSIDVKLRAETGSRILIPKSDVNPKDSSRTITKSLEFNNATFQYDCYGVLTANGINFTGDCTIQYTGAANASDRWYLLQNTKASDNGSITGSGSITVIGAGYLALKTQSATQVYTATNYTGEFIVGTSAAPGHLRLESANVLNSENGVIKVVNGSLFWASAQSFKSFEYYGGTLSNASGALTLSDEFKYDSLTDLTVPAVIAGSAKLTKEGSGTLTLSQVPQYTGSTTVETGTLELPGGSTLYNLSGGSESNPATLTVTGDLTLSNDDESTFIGSITAQKITVNTANDIALKLYTGANNKVTADSLTVSSGELDFKGYFSGNIEVFNGSVFSPGNSVGTATIKGDITFADATADSNGVALFEFGEYADGADVNHDLFVMESGGIFTADDGVILLDFAYNDENSWATVGNVFQLVSGGGFEDNVDYNPWLGNMTDLFKLEGRSADGLYLVGIKAAPEPGSGVPEPSTWALLLLGAAGLMYWRKRTRK